MSHRDLSKSLLFVSRLFHLYYLKANIYLPRDIDRREFAFQPLGKDTYVRHLSFKEESEVRRYLVENTPANAFYSSAIFMFPFLKDMEQKVWLGSELLFDIDADMLPGCEGTLKDVCLNCGFAYPGIAECPRCGSKSIVEAETVSERCLNRAKEQTEKLVEVLKIDFGIKELIMTYTGNRGFHVRVPDNDEFLRLGSDERREIASYIKGVGLSPEGLDIPVGKRRDRLRYAPHPSDGGWRGRLGRELYSMYGLDAKKRYTLEELWKLGYDYDLDDLVRRATIYIDEKVTMDIHRLVRIPGSLHGKTGLPSLILDIDKLRDFSLSCDLSPFKGRVEVIPTVDLDDIFVIDTHLNLRKDERKGLAHCYAVFLLLRGLARVI